MMTELEFQLLGCSILFCRIEYRFRISCCLNSSCWPNSLAWRPIDLSMGNSFGSYAEPGTRRNYHSKASPMVRDDDDLDTSEFRRRRGEGVWSRNVSIVFRRLHACRSYRTCL